MESQKIKILYAVGLGLVLSDIIPTPADAVVFWRQGVNKQKLEKSEITPKQYWVKETANYYLLNPIWWGSVLLASHYFGKTYEQKRNIFIGVIAAGVVVAVVSKNIKKDEEFYKKNTLVPNGK
jgi:hypothetical protein